MKVDALLFGFGGTLDTDGVRWSERYWDLYRELGLSVERSLFEDACAEADQRLRERGSAPGGTLRGLIEAQIALQLEFLHAEVTGFRGSAEQAKRLAARAYEGALEKIKEAAATLEALGRRFTLAVVSDSHANLERVLEEVGLRAHLALVIDAGSAGVTKPDPEIFRVALRRLGKEAERCAVVGSSYLRDIVPGKTAGCRTIWLRGRKRSAWEDTSRADVIVASVRDIPARLT